MARRELRAVGGFLRRRGQQQSRDMLAAQIQRGIRRSAAKACADRPNDPRTPDVVVGIYQGDRRMWRLIERAGISEAEIRTWAAEQIPLGEQDFADHEKRQAAQELKESYGKVGRNEPCPCGSGTKYKRCCGR